MTTGPASLLDRAAPWIAGVLLALPVVLLRYPPMTDLPLHEGMVALLRHFGDPAWAPSPLYELNLGHANQLVYLLATPLAFVVSTALACKLVVALAIVLSIVGGAHLAAHLGRTPWSALTVAPIAVGWTFYWGFLPNMLGLAALLWALPAIDRACEAPSIRRAAIASAIAVGLVFAHEASALAMCVAVAVFTFVRPLDRRTGLRMAPVLVVALFSVVEIARERSIETPIARVFGKTVMFHPMTTKLVCLTSFLAGAHGVPIEIALLAPALGFAVYGAVVRWKGRPGRGSRPPLRERAVDARFLVVALALLVVYFAAPYSVNFGAFLYQRFLPPAFVLAVVASSPAAVSRIAKLVAAVAPLAALAIVLPDFAGSSAQQNDLDALYPHVERASATFAFHLGGVGEPTLYSRASAANRTLAERGGRLEFSFVEYPIAPLVVPARYEWNESLLRLYADPSALRPSTDLDRYRYLLLHSNDDGLAAVVAESLAPDAVLVAQSGEWCLFESTHPHAALDSAEPPPAEHPPETLRDRIYATLRHQR